MFLFCSYIMCSSFAMKTWPCVMYQIYTWQPILPPTSSFGEMCVDSNLVTVLPYEWFLWKEVLVACSFWKNLMIITKCYKSREGTQRGSRQPLWERSVWTVERHVYKSYNVNLNLWIFTSDNDFHQMTEEEGEEGEMSISEALVSFSNFIHWPFFLCYFFFLFALNSGISS